MCCSVKKILAAMNSSPGINKEPSTSTEEPSSTKESSLTTKSESVLALEKANRLVNHRVSIV